MSATEYAAIARTYWTTYLPTQVASMEDAEAHFRVLGEEVAEAVATTVEQIVSTQPKPEGAAAQVAARKAALREAREIVLAEMVYLPPEPGTAHLEPPSTLPAGVETV